MLAGLKELERTCVDLESIIAMQLKYEKHRIESNLYAREKSWIWIETIRNALRSVEAIQAPMDAKEVAMNQTNDILELQRLARKWSAPMWRQAIIRKSAGSDSGSHITYDDRVTTPGDRSPEAIQGNATKERQRGV